MNRPVQTGTAIGFICVLAALSAATSFLPKTDNRIVCLDIATGELIWEYVPDKLSDAHFEWYRDGIVVYPHYDGTDRSNPIFLNVENGTLRQAFPRDPQSIHARSAVFWPLPDISLDNGWRLTGFRPGDDKTLTFCDRAGKETWRIKTGGYPHAVCSWNDLVFYAFSYLSDEGILYAYRAGEDKPTWTIDLNSIVKGRTKPLTTMIFQVIEGKIYLEANEHIFCIRPESGELLWHRDLAKELGLEFNHFCHGGLNLAVFAKSGNILVVSFEGRVVALDLETDKYLWHLQPDTFPHTPFPVAHANRVVLTAGSKRNLTRIPDNNLQP